ncbi:MAG: GDSL-type esterase/lipase family protein [Parabacteroides sp.]|nr:GDSL-type esterase/lipase family protein [Parabacteroides sp.]
MKGWWIFFLCSFSLFLAAEETVYPVSTRRYTYYSGTWGVFDLEVDLPRNGQEQKPYMIYIHGGGWQHGDRDVFKNHSIYMAERGIAGIRISYPLINQGGTFRRVMQLIEESVSFIHKHEGEWKLDSSRFGFCGASAGAHLAAMAAMKTGGCRLLVDMAGAYNLLDTKEGDFPAPAIKEKFIQAVDSSDLRRASALFHIPDRNIPACLFMHGTKDKVIDYRQSLNFEAALKKKGGLAETILYEHVDHGVNSRTNKELFEKVSNDMYLFCQSVFSRKRIACAGNSITYGYLTSSFEETYPYKLQKLLGKEFEVRNFGVPGAAVQFDKFTTYSKTKVYAEMKLFKPDVIILKLGTNDSRPDEWTNEDFFYADYLRLVRKMKNISDRVYLCYPIPPFGSRWKQRDVILRTKVMKIIKRVAKEEKLPVIDLYHTDMADSMYYFPDGIHPTSKGYTIMANSVYNNL